MAPFSLNIWRVIALFIIIMSASIVFIQKLFAFVHLQDNNSPSRFTEILFFITGAFCNQGNFAPFLFQMNAPILELCAIFFTYTIIIVRCNILPGMQQSTLDPVRMVHLVTYLTAVIILAAYSAALISFLTVNTFVMPFTTMEGLLKDESFRCGVIGNSAYYAFLQVYKFFFCRKIRNPQICVLLYLRRSIQQLIVN